MAVHIRCVYGNIRVDRLFIDPQPFLKHFDIDLTITHNDKSIQARQVFSIIGAMQEARIIVIVGMPGAGKSACVDHLTSKGYPNVYFGGIVIEETKLRYGRVNEELEKVVREDMRTVEGKGAIASRIIAKIEQLVAAGHTKIIADGLYSWTEYKMFKERWGANAVIVAIAAPRHVRHQRLANRPVRPLAEAEVTAREYAEIENIEKGGPIANADYTIVNNADEADLLAQFDKLLAAIGFTN